MNYSNIRSGLRRVMDILLAAVFLLSIAFITAYFTKRGENFYLGPFKALDGDTLLVGGEKLRLEGIDAPEYEQKCFRDQLEWRCGLQARNFLQKQLNTNVTCNAYGVDKYYRALVRCFSGEVDINGELVRNGFAVAYGAYYSEQRKAQAEDLGIWQGSFVMPQDWRENKAGPVFDLQKLTANEGGVLARMAGMARELYLWVRFW